MQPIGTPCNAEYLSRTLHELERLSKLFERQWTPEQKANANELMDMLRLPLRDQTCRRSPQKVLLHFSRSRAQRRHFDE